MDLKMITQTGAESGSSVSVSEEAFGKEFNEALVHQVVTAYLAAARSGTRGQKNRASVSGGGAKPFRQKGTGRARAGTIRSPLWRGGGKTFAAVPADYSQKVNRKMYRGAMRSILAELVRQERLVVVDAFTVEAPKTKQLSSALATLGLENVLIITNGVDVNVELAARNMANVDVITAGQVNPVSLIQFDKVLVTSDAVKQLEEMFA